MVVGVGSDGPVLTLLNNCLWVLQMQLEEPTSEDKPTIWALIDELQKLREALSSALAQELRQHSPNEVQLEGPSTSQPQLHQLCLSLCVPRAYAIHIRIKVIDHVIVSNSGRESTLAATDVASSTLRRIERDAIASATPITYLPRDLLLLIHEHLLASGLLQTASMLLEEAQLEPLPSLLAPSSLVQQPSEEEAIPVQLQWPSGRAPGILSNKLKPNAKDNDADQTKYKTPIIFPMKHGLSDLKDIGVLSLSKQLNSGLYTPILNLRDQQGGCTVDYVDESQSSMSNLGQVTVTPSSQVVNDYKPNNPERITLDSLVVQYLKHQHRQCQTPITTLPPLSLLHPHVCPEPKRSLGAPSNVTSRLATRELKFMYGGVHGNRWDRQFVYSRFRPSRVFVEDALLTCLTFLGDSYLIVVGDYPLTLVQSFFSGDRQMLLCSSSNVVKLWDAWSFLSDNGWDEIHSFDGCKAGRCGNTGNVFAALSSESAQKEILLYDIQTCQLASKLSDTSIGNPSYSRIHFSHSDLMLLWNGVLWDPRVSEPIHRFDQITDFGGGGFHPSRNEVIINSEVWDLRKFRLLHSVPSLDQTTITFNGHGDVIYAILRRNIEDAISAFHTHRVMHPLFAAFRTVDAVNYSDIATTQVDHCLLDFTTDVTDSFVGLLTVSYDEYEYDYMHSTLRIYEIGHRRPTDDDSDAESRDEDAAAVNPL
ncbi:DDB1- and CUL4-associated factor-like 1, partial [Mucuna pruriens]